jgi:hypothetical protein
MTRSVVNDSRSMDDDSRSKDDDSRSVIGNSRVTVQLVASFMIVIFIVIFLQYRPQDAIGY